MSSNESVAAYWERAANMSDEEANERRRAGWAATRAVPELTPVWVLLDSICVRVPGAPSHTVIDGLDMTGQVPGFLTAWHQSAKGDWLGEVNFAISYTDGRTRKLRVTGQLVPSYALRPRKPDHSV